MVILSSVCLIMFMSSSTVLAGSVKLAWEKPARNADGTEIDDLAGFKIYYGDTYTGIYSDSIDVRGVTSYRVKNLKVDRTYYFAVTAYDFSGNESSLSNEVSLIASNKSPSSPKPVSPGKGKKNVSTSSVFTWQQSLDPDGDTVTYDLIICEDPGLTSGCITETNIASVRQEGVYYAGIGNFGGGILIFSIIFSTILSIIRYIGARKKTLMWSAPILFVGILLLISCGGGPGNGGTVTSDHGATSQFVSEPVTGLNSNTIYYWQVIAKDSSGTEVSSDVWSFQTL